MIMDSVNTGAANDLVNEDEASKKRNRNPFIAQKQKDDKSKRRQKRSRIIIRNISYKATDDTLKEHFTKYGNIIDLNILKRADGKLVGCAFIQYDTVNQAAKAILKTNNKPYLGRPIFVDWAVGKNEYELKKAPTTKTNTTETINEEDQVEEELKIDEANDSDINENESDEDIEEMDTDDEIGSNDEDGGDDSDDCKSETQEDIKDEKLVKVSRVTNDVKEGCTIFIKNVPFDATNDSLRKVCRKYGPVYYVIINTDTISKHSKGTAFVKYKTKDSADLCLKAGEEFTMLNTVMQPFPALSRQEIITGKSKTTKAIDSRNLYLVKEGIIMTGSKAAEGVSASDLNKRHKLEQVKATVLKDLNRFVSRNRLSIHNLPPAFDDDKLKDLIIKHTQMKPHECKVMRENKPTMNAPQGKSKGFGFMSFNTHLDALHALRKLNNNPTVFGALHRPIVGFSIEDRSVHNIKEKRLKKSRENNPMYKNKLDKLQQRKEKRKLAKVAAKTATNGQPLTNKNQSKDRKPSIKKFDKNPSKATVSEESDFVGMPSKPGSFIRMRSGKKIREQSMEHKKKLGEQKRKEKQKKEKRMHRAERMQVDRTKIGKQKQEKDNFSVLVNKYKGILDSRADKQNHSSKKLKSKWYID